MRAIANKENHNAAATANNGAVDRALLSPSPPPSSTSLTARPSTKKCLRFSPTTTTVPTLALSDYKDEEYDKTWPTEDEDIKSQRHLVQTLQLMQTSNGHIAKEYEEDFTTRGLESMTSSADLERAKASKKRVINAVLDEQERACVKGVEHEIISSRLATISSSLSREARDRALALGSRDATEISS